jgi:hypothetical protein
MILDLVHLVDLPDISDVLVEVDLQVVGGAGRRLVYECVDAGLGELDIMPEDIDTSNMQHR